MFYFLLSLERFPTPTLFGTFLQSKCSEIEPRKVTQRAQMQTVTKLNIGGGSNFCRLGLNCKRQPFLHFGFRPILRATLLHIYKRPLLTHQCKPSTGELIMLVSKYKLSPMCPTPVRAVQDFLSQMTLIMICAFKKRFDCIGYALGILMKDIS